jgi:hypothetical protein
MMMLLPLLSTAFALPNIDQPLKTGNRSPNDAAVVVGIEDYAFVGDVPYASRDAAAFYDALVYTVGIPSDRVRLLDRGASKEQILGAVDDAARLVDDGTVWVYFAGHGAADVSTGARMLLGDDVRQDPKVFDARGVKVDELVTRAASNGGSVRLITDACYGGTGRSGQEVVSGMRFAVPSYAAKPASNQLLWYAAEGDQLAGPLEATEHGAFTYLVIGALRGWADGEIDGNPDGQVTAEEAQAYVSKGLRSLQIVGQRPEMQATNRAGTVLISGDRLEAAPQLTAPPAARESGPTQVALAPELVAGRLDPNDRAGTVEWIQGTVNDCVARHAPATNTWVVKAKFTNKGTVKPIVMGSMSSGGATQLQLTPSATSNCIGQALRHADFVVPSANIGVNGTYTAR